MARKRATVTEESDFGRNQKFQLLVPEAAAEKCAKNS